MTRNGNRLTSSEAQQTFSERSGQYASARPAYPCELFEWIAANSPNRDAVWDCATGNGQAAVGLSPYYGNVSATDVSAEQLAHAVPRDNVIYRVAPAENSGLPTGSFDTVSVAQALHWFNLPRFWAEVARVSRPGALFCAWGYDWLRSSPDIDARLVTPFREIISPFWAPNNRLLWNGYRPDELAFPFDVIETPQFTIRADWRLNQLIAYMQTWSAFKRSQMDPGATADMDQLLAESGHLARPDVVVPVVMGLKMIAGRVNGAKGDASV